MSTELQRLRDEVYAQRRTIIEHMQKYEEAMRRNDRGLAQFQADTISRAQEVIRRAKDRAGWGVIADDAADSWRPLF